MLILETERTILSPLKKEDFQEIIQMYLEPESNKFVPPLQNKTKEEYRLLLQQKLLKNNQPKGHGIWTIREKSNDKFIGTANLNIQKMLQLTHLGAHLVHGFWGKGYATEVLSRLKDYALSTVKIPVLHALVDEQHHVSKKMLVKIGMSYSETIKLYDVPIELYQFL
jgi:RimJ/RimL family protein N-acetyltransferase